MNTLTLKSQIQKMINELDDINILNSIYSILDKATLDPEMKSILSKRAEKSEEDIKHGRTLTMQDFINKTSEIGR